MIRGLSSPRPGESRAFRLDPDEDLMTGTDFGGGDGSRSHFELREWEGFDGVWGFKALNSLAVGLLSLLGCDGTGASDTVTISEPILAGSGSQATAVA